MTTNSTLAFYEAFAEKVDQEQQAKAAMLARKRKVGAIHLRGNVGNPEPSAKRARVWYVAPLVRVKVVGKRSRARCGHTLVVSVDVAEPAPKRVRVC